MATFARAIFTVSEFLRWSDTDRLVLQPKFQRRMVWEPAARSYLIDTIVRGLPIPKLYMRKVVYAKTKLSAYEVVDGQQRLRAIIDFCRGRLVLSGKHNAQLGDVTFDDLPDPVRRRLLSYEISVEVMEKATDEEVWAMFERLNTYTLTLNRQERLNAKWFGDFKQTAYRLAAEQSSLDVWRNLKIFSNQQISRMKEVELTSDIIVAMLKGISDITDIGRVYKEYDAAFSKATETSKNFKKTISWITDEVAEAVRITRFKRKTWFYSLSVAVADVLFGIPQGNGPKATRHAQEIIQRMQELDKAMKVTDPSTLPSGLSRLLQSLSRQTSHVTPRLVRHEFFFAMLTYSDSKWADKTGQ